MENSQRENYKLENLDNYELENSDQDLRGQTLRTPDGKPIGKVDDMFVDTRRERICALRLDDDRVIDIDDVDMRDGEPVLLVPQERIPQPGPDFDRNNVTTRHIPIVEERLEVGKRPIETGGLKIRKRVVEEPVSKQVDVRDEHVEVDRRPVNERVGDREAGAMFKDQDIDVTERGEKVVAGKEARVKEDLVVNKETGSHKETVQDTVRHTEVDVDRKPGERR